MKTMGMILFVVGLGLLGYGLTMDTSVAVDLPYGLREFAPKTPERVHNIGLMNQQRNLLILGGFLSVIGAGLWVGGTVTESQKTSVAGKKCQKCAEIIQAEAVVCRYCGTDVGTTDHTGSPSSGIAQGQVEQYASGEIKPELAKELVALGQIKNKEQLAQVVALCHDNEELVSVSSAKSGNNLLHVAAALGALEEVKSLVALGLSPESKNLLGHNPMQMATSDAVVKFLQKVAWS